MPQGVFEGSYNSPSWRVEYYYPNASKQDDSPGLWTTMESGPQLPPARLFVELGLRHCVLNRHSRQSTGKWPVFVHGEEESTTKEDPSLHVGLAGPT